MKRSPLSAESVAAAAAAPPPAHPTVLPFQGQLLPTSQGPNGPLRNQLYPLEVARKGETDASSGLVPSIPRGTTVTLTPCSITTPNQQPGAPQAGTKEVITVEDDEDEATPHSSSKAPQALYASLEVNDCSGDGSSSSSNAGATQAAEAVVSRQQSASEHVDSPSQGEAPAEDKVPSEEPPKGPWASKVFCGAHSKSLWLHGRQRPEHIEKHLSDLRTKFSVGKVSLRNPIFPSAAAAAAFIRAVSHIPRVTSLTLNAPEMPEEQFLAICEGLGYCSYLNHIDCNAIGSKPLRPAALQLLLQRLQMLPDLREVNLSGNEFASPGPPGGTGDTGLGVAGANAEPPLDGFQLLKGLLLRGVLCLLARECGLRQLRRFLLWVLNRCHCLRLRQLDLGASSKLLTTVVPGETFDEEVRAVPSRALWRLSSHSYPMHAPHAAAEDGLSTLPNGALHK